MNEDQVVFDAKIGNWICIKKQKVKQDSPAIENARILASIHDSMDRKIWDFLGGEFDLEAIDKVAYDITEAQYNEKKKTWGIKGRISEDHINQSLAKLNSPSVLRGVELPKNKFARNLAKTYLNRKVLGILKFSIELDPKIVEKYINKKPKLS